MFEGLAPIVSWFPAKPMSFWIYNRTFSYFIALNTLLNRTPTSKTFTPSLHPTKEASADTIQTFASGHAVVAAKACVRGLLRR